VNTYKKNDERISQMKINLSLLTVFMSIGFALSAGEVGAAEQEKWESIFDGKTLKGWTQRGGKARYEVEDNAIVGSTVPNTPNSFLCTEKIYRDFILELEYKVDPKLNSGVQIRSNSYSFYNKGRVHGYQVEIDPSERAFSAGIYDEARRGWLNDLKNNEPARKAFKQNEWNHYRIEAIGDSLKTWINGVPAADLIDTMTRSGFIALQVHSSGSTEPLQVRWRNIRIQDLTAGPVPTEKEIKQITAAAPDKPTVQPTKPRRLLVFSRSYGFKHTSISYGRKAVEIMAKKTGAFEVVTSDDLFLFKPENLKHFDAIFFNNTNNEIFLPENFDKLSKDKQAAAVKLDEELKKNLVDFIASGKGLGVLHAGVASFRNWPEFGEIIGARFDNHPWVSGSEVTLKVDEPRHPVAQAFKNPTWVVSDEIYQVKAPYTRDNLRVLLSIDTEKTNMNVGGIHRKDKDFAMTWIKSYGQGRVFYFALGHQHELFWNPVFLQHILDGIQFALGDLEGDTTPSSKL
jgi:type 1 glutamine amidotransferase